MTTRLAHRNYDVVVAGAGPAGSSAARAAARAGARVLLLDKRTCVGSPVQCGELIPARLAQIVPLPPGAVSQEITAIRLHLPDGTVREASRSNQALGYVLNRDRFDQALAEQACAAGAELILGARLLDVSKCGIIASMNGQRLEAGAHVIVGADGPRSTVGRRLGLVHSRYFRAAQCEAAWDGPAGVAEFYFYPECREGYGWVFSKGKTANIGAGCQGDALPALRLLLRGLGVLPEQIIRWKGGLLPAGGPLPATMKGKCLLAGNAAGQVDPVTGEGIRIAVVCGILAGRYAAAAARSGDTGELNHYETRWRQLFAAQLAEGMEQRRFMEANWSDDAGRLTRVIAECWEKRLRGEPGG